MFCSIFFLCRTLGFDPSYLLDEMKKLNEAEWFLEELDEHSSDEPGENQWFNDLHVEVHPRFDPMKDEFILPEEMDPDADLPYEPMAQPKRGRKCNQFCFCRGKAPPLDPLNVNLLLTFMNEEGELLPKRKTNLCAKWQRKVSRTVKRARHLGMFSYKKGRFTFVDPFTAPPDPTDDVEEAAYKFWIREYPDVPFPGYPEGEGTRTGWVRQYNSYDDFEDTNDGIDEENMENKGVEDDAFADNSDDSRFRSFKD